MVFVVVTLAATLIIDLAVLAALKAGLSKQPTADVWGGRQPC